MTKRLATSNNRTPDGFKHPATLHTTVLDDNGVETGEVIKSKLFWEKEELEKWVSHEVKEMGVSLLRYEIVDM